LVDLKPGLELMNDKQRNLGLPSLPPRMPQNEAELKRTIILLGNRKQVELKTDAHRQLESLIGVYPTIPEAALWKRVLRRACQEKFLTAK
jgi:hypothetical protein